MNQPSLATFTGLARMEFSTTARGAGSYEAGVAAGGPLIIDVLGFRVSSWYQREGGFIDRINQSSGTTVENNVNREINKSVRGTLTWAPTGSVRITPTLDYESFGIHDTPTFYVPLSSLKEGELRTGALVQQPFDHVFYLASVKLNSGFTSADLNSVTSYFHRRAHLTVDWPVRSTGDPVPVEAVGLQPDYMQRVFTQEIRL